MSQENRGENLYTRIYRLLVTEQYAEAEQVLDEHFSLDPSSREAILSWTELKLVQGQPDAAIERLAPLTISFPTDPYYMLAAAEVEPGGERQLVTVVARQVHGHDVPVPFGHRAHDRPAVIARAVVDQHDLIIVAKSRLRSTAQPQVQLGEAGFLIEARDDDRQHQCRR